MKRHSSLVRAIRSADVSPPAERQKDVASCSSNKCGGGKWAKNIEKPDVPRGALDCPDCGEALNWNHKRRMVRKAEPCPS
jgi:hypothetical protein